MATAINPPSQPNRDQNKAKLHSFTWTGKNHEGVLVEGTIDATSIRVARMLLRRQGVRPIKIGKTKTAKKLGGGKVKHEDVVVMTRQLGTMIESGIPMVQAMDAVSQGNEKAPVRALLNSIRGEIETGDTLSTVLSRYPKHFDNLYVGLVAVGEESGTLDIMLVSLATYLEKVESIKKKIKSAMTYPIIVLSAGVLIMGLLLTKVIPQFASIFDNYGAALPWLTQTLLDMSDALRENFVLVVVSCIAFVIGFVTLYRTNPKFHYVVDKYTLKIPIFGPLLRKGILARLSRTIAIMFRAGVPMVDTLKTISAAAGNDVYRNALDYTRNEITTGRALEPSMRQTGEFPGLILQMVRTGEETGEMDKMLDRAADFYEEEVDTTVATISSLIEPILVLFLGVMIGTVVVGMYLPIFKLASVF